MVAVSALSVLFALLAVGRLEVSVTFGKTPPTRTPTGQPVEERGRDVRTDTSRELVANLTQIVPAARKEASPRMRMQGMIERVESKELGNSTELAVDEIKKWSGYRLGDIMRYWREAFFLLDESEVVNPTVCRRWPSSFGCLFLNISTSRVPSTTKRDREKYKDRKKREKLFTDILGETLRGQGKDIRRQTRWLCT